MQRRDMLGAMGLAGLAGGIAPDAEAPPEASLALEFAYDAIVTLGAATPVGRTPYGVRNRIPITGGSFEGPRIRGTVLAGGMDWQLERPDGMLDIHADYMMQVEDGTLIHVINKGLISRDPKRPYVRTTPWFEVPDGPHGWLNQSIFTGTIGTPPEGKGPAVRITIHRIL
ncbi:DUF3237 domain-containing protein [Sphingomonas sp. ABOLD]|uniref:UPF0311 protein GGR89_002578 n=1 Tax=Sphingomonas trueperi TaxID=53317 RepID=A0A7X5Y069_9SPHN|nr:MULTISPECIES: DUF3237 domain-containing protein [Sphingomonas]NJB98247.1 hypothetical protein [Sphingomonas trueperi]RSV41302.1 DUF3237 domain-containing protein [Sphingomonas sp. ABOLD]RSV45512.1 DUF3237 domain-containing protein [Sphingomonas sp. ABOLE]